MADRPASFLAEVQATARRDGKRSDGIATVVRVAKALASRVANWRVPTTRPTWELLAKVAGCTRRQVGRILAWLRGQGLVSIVATGQSAQHSRTGENEAAVYALWSCGRAQPAADDGEELDVTPTPLLGEFIPTCAREERCSQTDSLTGDSLLVESPANRLARLRRRVFAGDPTAAHAGADQAEPRLGKRAKARKERLARAAQLRREVPVLRRTSVRAVAAVIRPLIEAGWTDRDIVQAIDWQPSGIRWPHSADFLIARPDLWLKHRLAAWINEGDNPQVIESPSQRRDRERAERLEREQLRAAEAAAAARIRAAEQTARDLRYGKGTTARQAARLMILEEQNTLNRTGSQP